MPIAALFQVSTRPDLAHHLRTATDPGSHDRLVGAGPPDRGFAHVFPLPCTRRTLLRCRTILCKYIISICPRSALLPGFCIYGFGCFLSLRKLLSEPISRTLPLLPPPSRSFQVRLVFSVNTLALSTGTRDGLSNRGKSCANDSTGTLHVILTGHTFCIGSLLTARTVAGTDRAWQNIKGAPGQHAT